MSFHTRPVFQLSAEKTSWRKDPTRRPPLLFFPALCFLEGPLKSVLLFAAESGVKRHTLQVRLRGFSTELTSHPNDPDRAPDSRHPRPLCHYHHQHAHGGPHPQAVLRQIQRAHFFSRYCAEPRIL